MTKHTPGPWKAIEWTCHACSTVVTDYGLRAIVADCAPPSGYVDEEAEANARLIAAAPDLLSEAEINLSVLRDVHKYLRNRPGNEEVQLCEMVGESISHSEAAIRSAKGELQ